jgi:15-cis-phytoene synthase
MKVLLDMNESVGNYSSQGVWGAEEWAALERATRVRALESEDESARWFVINREARRVMRVYTTSFFIVSRFLPAVKRAEVEAVYAAVRYPDEIVDTFPLTPEARRMMLDRWQQGYEAGLACSSLEEALREDVPCFLAAFTKVVRERGIPHEHYRAFLDAMRTDTAPRRFETFEDLVENYVYGSAVVVGFFLTHVYGARSSADFKRALEAARALGIALQLTNFLRDVAEDQRRGRVYLPQDMLRGACVEDLCARDARQQRALTQVLRRLARIAEEHYARALADLDAFSPDCRLAIHACIKVYGQLNERIAASNHGIAHRESVPLKEKLRVLPPSKYWRIPLAYLTR